MTRKLSIRRRGNILVLAAVLMVVMLALVAFAIDTGRITLARTQLQTAADAAALAGAQALSDGSAEAKLLAQNAAQDNDAVGSPVVIVPTEDIKLGRWNVTTGTLPCAACGGTNTENRISQLLAAEACR